MDEMMSLRRIVRDSDNIVFFGGAGVSTESGIPDFRSADGLYRRRADVAPEMILSRSYYQEQTREFFDFYRERILFPHAQPGPAHIKLAELEKQRKLRAVITQNIDGLHQRAGSCNVLELHGSVRRNGCERCGEVYDEMFIKQSEGVPVCPCGGAVHPDVVLYEDPLNAEVFRKAAGFISRAEVLIVAGTSLAVYPAAGLVNEFRGKDLIIINRGPTQNDGCATLLIRGSIGEVLSKIETGD